MQRTLPLLILAVILTAVVCLWVLQLLNPLEQASRGASGPQPGDILSRENLPLVDQEDPLQEAPHSTDFAPWEVLLPGLPFPPPTTNDALIWASEMEIHFPYLAEPTRHLVVREQSTGFPVPGALVMIGPRGLLAWQRKEAPAANLEGLLMRNGLAFRTDMHGRLRTRPEWEGLPISVRYGDYWGSGVLRYPDADGDALFFVAKDRGILVSVRTPYGAEEGVQVGMFVESDGEISIVRQAETDENGFAWLLHATDPGIRRPKPSTWWVGFVDPGGLAPRMTYDFDLLPLRPTLNPDPGPKPAFEKERFYPLGVNKLED